MTETHIPTGTRDDPWERVRTAVDAHGHHLVSFAMGSMDDPAPEGGHIAEMTHALLSPTAALRLAQALINVATPQMGRLVEDASRGDCETCSNLRMVNVERHGRPWSEHCPDCSANPSATNYGPRPAPPVPTLPNWAERERRVLAIRG